MKHLLINLGYFFAGAGIINTVAYKPLKAYYEKTDAYIQLLVENQRQ
jgi:hypothetical protein